jgi:hypothetical protein
MVAAIELLIDCGYSIDDLNKLNLHLSQQYFMPVLHLFYSLRKSALRFVCNTFEINFT